MLNSRLRHIRFDINRELASAQAAADYEKVIELANQGAMIVDESRDREATMLAFTYGMDSDSVASETRKCIASLIRGSVHDQQADECESNFYLMVAKAFDALAHNTPELALRILIDIEGFDVIFPSFEVY
jgi:hypothetical protein